MSAELEKLLESVAREAGEQGHYLQSVAVLKRRLLPLLEAGQAMRDRSEIAGSVTQEFGQLERIWDAAKQKALEP